MNDRERVLLNIAVDASGSFCDTIERIKGGWSMKFRFGNPAPQFMPLEMAEAIKMPLKKGDIVRCNTNPNHHWGIAEYVESKGYADWLLKEIGGERLCNMGNESLEVLRFMNPSRLYAGAKHRIYKWASGKAFSERYNPDADYCKRCGGVEFDGDKLIIWSRVHIFGQEKKGDDGQVLYAQPRRFEMTWSESTRLKDIVAAMREQGFAKKYEYGPEEPTKGNAGFAKITRDDLLNVLQTA